MGEMMSEELEPFSYCERCSKPIFDGDAYHAGSDVDLCADCAPSYADLLASPDSFANSDEVPLTADEAQQIYSRHISSGGSPGDKLGIPSTIKPNGVKR